MSQPHDFPFDITDVAELLHLRIRRPSPQGLYVDCPICNDKRGKMHINTQSDTWRCNYCDESGGMLALYAKVHSISTSTAYREISDALLNGVNLSDHAVKFPDKPKETPVEAAPAADIAVRNKTYTALLAMLTLSKEHRAHLQTVRGLPDEQIERLGYKTMPPFYMCRSLANRLQQNGHQLDGVPGFYQKDGQWTIASSSFTAGIMIPARTRQGLISGFQIRLDVPLKNEDDPPEKDGAKYIWFSSAGKPKGTSSGSPAHFVGDPNPSDLSEQMDLYRSIVQKAIATCLGVPNRWVLKKKREDVNECCTSGEGSRQYPDYNYYGNLSMLKTAAAPSHFVIGGPSLCVCCGQAYHSGHLKCRCEDTVVCKDCGNTVPKQNARYIEGVYHCHACLHICGSCGEMIHGTMYPAYDRRGRLVEICEACYRASLEPCAACSVCSICRIIGNAFCHRTSVTAAEGGAR